MKMNSIKIHFLIVTYNRREGLQTLLESIDCYCDNKIATVVDDVSQYNVEKVIDQFPFVKLIKNKEHNGKKFFWKTITTLYQDVKQSDADYFISIQDDKYLLPHTVDEAIYYWRRINDPNKILLNIYTHLDRYGKAAKDVRVKPTPVLFEKCLVLNNYWTDHHFLTTKEYFGLLNYRSPKIPHKRFIRSSRVASGVGGAISKLLYNSGRNMYSTPRNLIGFGQTMLNSRMNPNMRRKDHSKYINNW